MQSSCGQNHFRTKKRTRKGLRINRLNPQRNHRCPLKFILHRCGCVQSVVMSDGSSAPTVLLSHNPTGTVLRSDARRAHDKCEKSHQRAQVKEYDFIFNVTIKSVIGPVGHFLEVCCFHRTSRPDCWANINRQGISRTIDKGF